MERKRVLIAFGDILGFQGWTIRPSKDPEVFDNLIDKVYDEFDLYMQKSGCEVKLLGDGLFSIQELVEERNDKTTADFLKNVYELSLKVSWIMRTFWPRPDGFRMRVTSGYVSKRYIQNRKEYIGYAVNLAKRLLEVYPELLCICHQSVKEIIGEQDLGVVFEQLDTPDNTPERVDPQDLNGLWSFFSPMSSK